MHSTTITVTSYGKRDVYVSCMCEYYLPPTRCFTRL